MKRIIVTLIAAFFAVSLFAQAPTSKESSDSELRKYLKTLSLEVKPRYKLYSSKPNWPFLELDTATGRIWQIHFSFYHNQESRYKTPLNEKSLITSTDETGEYNGRFELYKTDNEVVFILLDCLTGDTWHVQWGYEGGGHIIKKISLN